MLIPELTKGRFATSITIEPSGAYDHPDNYFTLWLGSRVGIESDFYSTKLGHVVKINKKSLWVLYDGHDAPSRFDFHGDRDAGETSRLVKAEYAVADIERQETEAEARDLLICLIKDLSRIHEVVQTTGHDQVGRIHTEITALTEFFAASSRRIWSR